MQIQKREGSVERRIVTGMIVDEAVLGKLADKWNKEYVTSPWAATVGQWCVDYFTKYSRAPGKAIAGLFESWAAGNEDKDGVALVERFLETLSGDYTSAASESNAQYIIDLAGEHFTEVKLRRYAEALIGDLDNKDLTKARQRVAVYDHPNMLSNAGIDVLRDRSAISGAFASKGDPLITYPGALGEFFGDSLERDGFVAFMGPEKRGKTWWLMDLAWMGMRQGRRVAFFEVGDMSQNQVMRRFMIRAANHPGDAGTVQYPMGMNVGEPGEPVTVDFSERVYDTDLDEAIAWQACQDMVTKSGHTGKLLNLSCYPNSSISVPGIRGEIRVWERTGWVPDIVIVDYADIIAPINGTADSRDQINATWKALRAMSQELHCLVVTATQADAASYKADTIDRTNFSEDKRKYAHVTGMVGINSTLEEKDRGVQRLNWVVLRERQFSEGQCVHVAGCLALGRPHVRSTF